METKELLNVNAEMDNSESTVDASGGACLAYDMQKGVCKQSGKLCDCCYEDSTKFV